MEKDNSTITINLIICGVVSLVIGIIYIFLGIFLKVQFPLISNIWGLIMIIEGILLECVSFGLFAKHILPNKKGSFFIGLVLGIIGVVIAICMRPNENK